MSGYQAQFLPQCELDVVILEKDALKRATLHLVVGMAVVDMQLSHRRSVDKARMFVYDNDSFDTERSAVSLDAPPPNLFAPPLDDSHMPE